jgi:hypothetical protein
MKAKAALIIGAAAGYVLGAKAGKERYEQIREGAVRLWRDPRVQEKTAQAQDMVRESAPRVQEKVGSAARQAKGKVKTRADDGSAGTSAGVPSDADRPAGGLDG